MGKEFDYDKMREFVRQSKEDSIGADLKRLKDDFEHKKQLH